MATMTPGVRKLALTAHITTSVGWMGAVGCFLALAVAGVASKDHEIIQAAYLAMAVICWFVIVPLSIASPASGIIQAIGTPWGLLRHHWVLIKLLVTVPCTAVLLLHMMPTTEVAAVAAQGQVIGDALRDLRIQLVADSIAALAVLLLTTVLAIYKPPGLTARGTRESRANVLPRSLALPGWVVWLRRFAALVAIFFVASHLAGKGIGGHGLHLGHTPPTVSSPR